MEARKTQVATDTGTRNRPGAKGIVVRLFGNIPCPTLCWNDRGAFAFISDRDK